MIADNEAAEISTQTQQSADVSLHPNEWAAYKKSISVILTEVPRRHTSLPSYPQALPFAWLI